jgi:polyferredoxin
MAIKSQKLRAKGVRNLRHIIQAGFFVLVAVTVTMEKLGESGIKIPILPSGSLHSICPFGGVVSFWQLFNLGTLVKKVHQSSIVLGLIGIFLAVLLGPVICGWICPFGTFQEFFGKLGKKIFGKKYNNFIPKKLDNVLRYLRYAIFAWVTYMTIVTGKLIFEAYDPYFALFRFWTGEVAITGFIALGIVLIMTLFVERPFCKYACPYGAFLGIFNLFRIFGIRRNAPTCISCNACTKACPMNIDVANKKVVRDHQCISCLECTSEVACPVPATVEVLAFAGQVKDTFDDSKVKKASNDVSSSGTTGK